MADSVVKASDNDKSVYLDPVNLVKSYLSTSILFSNALTEFSRKKNLRNIIGANFLVLCGPKPRTTSVKTKTKSH